MPDIFDIVEPEDEDEYLDSYDEDYEEDDYEDEEDEDEPYGLPTPMVVNATNTCVKCMNPTSRMSTVAFGIRIERHPVCASCYTLLLRCSCGLRLLDNDSRITDIHGYIGCPNCVSISQCEGCDKEISVRGGGLVACKECKPKATPCFKCGQISVSVLNFKCLRCRQGMWTNFRPILLDYTTDILRTPLGNGFNPNTKNLLFGVELEVAVARRHQSLYKEIAEHTARLCSGSAILKWDRSIDQPVDDNGDRVENHPYCGFEIVTKPMTFKEQIAFWKGFLAERHSLLRGWEPESCGQHIHINRRPFTPLDTGKLQVFINDPDNYGLIRHCARRSSERYARLIPKKLSAGYDSSTGGHYDAVNIRPQHSSTIEFRIFRASVRMETVISNIQFVQALTEFIRRTPPGLLKQETFIRYVEKQQPSRFRELRNHLTALGSGGYNESRVHNLT